MIKNAEISMWDLLVYFMSGGLLLTLIAFHLMICGVNIFEILRLMNASTVLVVLPSISFIVGLLIEPLANRFEKILLDKIRKKFSLRTRSIEVQYYKEIQGRASKLIEPELPAQELYHFCKDFIIQRGVPSPFMAFLSKFGFYRNAEFIFYLNALICCVQAIRLGLVGLWGLSFALAIVCLFSIVFAGIFGSRSIDFFGHMTSTVYNNFIATYKKDAN